MNEDRGLPESPSRAGDGGHCHDGTGVTATMRFGAPGGSPAWLRFCDPVDVLAAYEIGDVLPVLREVERHAQEDRWSVGYVAYEAAPAFDSALTTRSPRPGLPLAWFSVHDSPHSADSAPAGSALSADGPPQVGTAITADVSGFGTGPWLLPDRSDHTRVLAGIHDEIADGNTYQVNFATQLSAQLDGTVEQLFAELYRRQPTDFGAYLDLGEHAIVSVSPELFFELQGSIVTMRPMKGTVARGATPEQDAANQRWLLSSAKNRAENTMIVDLLRNDLGRIARTGTVRVDDLVQLESFPTFHALTSTIRAEVDDADLCNLFAALFPCGSITGAPKASTMRIIAGLESEPRGPYCGAIGVVAPGGDARFSVAIRTAVVGPDSVVRYGVGGGITADSIADEEYVELLTKARIVLALPGPSLLETFRLHDGAAHNIDLHLARMSASAAELGYDYDETRAHAAVQGLRAQYASGTWRARLLLDRGALFHAEAAPFELDAHAVMTARVSPNRVVSADSRLRHKLTDRALYDSRREPDVDTTLLVNEHGELTEFLFGNIVVRRGDELFTPPLGAGLLPGVGRALALADGVQERAITLDELDDRDEVWHVNSLRGWSRVDLLP